MICLDTNYLIRGLITDSLEAERLLNWSEAGELLIVPSVVWYEFTSGPVTPHHAAAIRALIQNVVSFDESQAEIAAQLWNASGRKRHLRVDAMIAATAISTQSSLATQNQKDFLIFTEHGLELIS